MTSLLRPVIFQACEVSLSKFGRDLVGTFRESFRSLYELFNFGTISALLLLPPVTFDMGGFVSEFLWRHTYLHNPHWQYSHPSVPVISIRFNWFSAIPTADYRRPLLRCWSALGARRSVPTVDGDTLLQWTMHVGYMQWHFSKVNLLRPAEMRQNLWSVLHCRILSFWKDNGC